MTAPPFAVRHYPELDSTNEEAKRLLAQEHFSSPVIVRANSQTAGKGTQGRQWFSPPGAGLYFSVVHSFEAGTDWRLPSMHPNGDDPFHSANGWNESNESFNEAGPIWSNNPGANTQQTGSIPLTPLFTLAAGVACAETVAALTGLTIQLKPINDLYVEGRKLGGILTESLISENRCKALITGIGINLREHEAVQDGCAQEQRGHQPISLQACIAPHLFQQWHPDALMEELSQAIAMAVDEQYRRLVQGRTATLLKSYHRYKLPEVDLPENIYKSLG